MGVGESYEEGRRNRISRHLRQNDLSYTFQNMDQNIFVMSYKSIHLYIRPSVGHSVGINFALQAETKDKKKTYFVYTNMFL